MGPNVSQMESDWNVSVRFKSWLGAQTPAFILTKYNAKQTANWIKDLINPFNLQNEIEIKCNKNKIL